MLIPLLLILAQEGLYREIRLRCPEELIYPMAFISESHENLKVWSPRTDSDKKRKMTISNEKTEKLGKERKFPDAVWRKGAGKDSVFYLFCKYCVYNRCMVSKVE